MLLTLTAPADNERGPQYMEQALAAIHQGNVRRLPVTFRLASDGNTIQLSCQFARELAPLIAGQLGAHYPDIDVKLANDRKTETEPSPTWSADLHLRPDVFPIRRAPQFEDPLNRSISDPLTALFAAIGPDSRHPYSCAIELAVVPSPPRRRRHALRALRRLSSPLLSAHPNLARWYIHAATSPSLQQRFLAGILALLARPAHQPPAHPPESSARSHDREDDLQAAADKLARHLFTVSLRLLVSAPIGKRDAAVAKLQRMAGALGQFTVPRMASFHASLPRFLPSQPTVPARRGFLLSCEELATLWHPPTATVRAPAMLITESRELEPPALLPIANGNSDLAVLGRVAYRSRREAFGVKPDDRRRHLAIIGKTGMGKTTLLHRLIATDIQAGRGLALIDPHGDLADALLDAIPPPRTNDVVIFDAGDREYPVSFNPLAYRDADQRGLVASGVVSSFKKLYGNSWGPRLEHILRNALLALLEVPGTSLLSLLRMLSDYHYRKSITDRLTDPVVRTFWHQEFAHWKPQFQAEAVAPILNKVGQFLSQPILRSILGQARTRLDLRRVMDEGQVLIVNLSKGKIGEDGSALLGSLLVTGLQLAAMSRADVPEAHRRDFHLYVDEFQNFATESFATILSEARKYRLSLVLANQYLAQMDEATAAAVFGNVGSLLVFQVGAQDAEVLAEQLGGNVVPRDLLALPRYRAYLRLLIDGMPSRPFSIETLPPPPPAARSSRAETIRRTSRHRYARAARQVEAEIRTAFK